MFFFLDTTHSPSVFSIISSYMSKNKKLIIFMFGFEPELLLL